MPPDDNATTIETPPGTTTGTPPGTATGDAGGSTPPTSPAPEWVKDPLYAGVVKDLDPKLIRATPHETLAEIGKAHRGMVDKMSRTRPIEANPPDKTPDKATPKPDANAAKATSETTGLDIASTPEQKGVNAIIAKAGFAGKEKELAEQWEKEGKFTDEQYAAFAKVGRDREEIDAIAAGMHARRTAAVTMMQQARSKALEILGGEEGLATIGPLARQHMDPGELKEIETMLAGKNAPMGARLLKAWHAEFAASADGGGGDGDGGGEIIRGERGGAPSAGKPKTLAEARALMDRANQGDRAALRALKDVDLTTLA